MRVAVHVGDTLSLNSHRAKKYDERVQTEADAGVRHFGGSVRLPSCITGVVALAEKLACERLRSRVSVRLAVIVAM